MKKIDVNKSLIFSNKVEDVKNSLEYLDQEGYFSNDKDFSDYKDAKLDAVRVSNVANFLFSPYTFVRYDFYNPFNFFIPKSKAVFIEEEPERKTLRPFKSISEFCRETGIKNFGDPITIRLNNGNFEDVCIFNGYRTLLENNQIIVFLGAVGYTLEELKDNHCYFKNGEWFPFGVEE